MKRRSISWRVSLAVLLVWLLLVGELSLAQLLLGGLLAWLAPFYSERLRGEHAGVRRPLVAARLGLLVLWDIVVSNVQVARLILQPRLRLRSAFIDIPLDLRNVHGITALASIITMTPGTVSADLSSDRRVLRVHCLDVDDAAAAVAQIKDRYERPLREIFPDAHAD